jgi:L-asparaginase
MPRPSIAVLYVGGSIGMIRNQKTGRIEPIESIAEIHRFLPEIQREAALKFFPIANLGSSEVTPDHWVTIATTIAKNYDAFDGFVVIHGTNTMSYTAAALSFALQGLSKPVVLTGAIMPLNELSGDGRMNLVFAVRAAMLDLAEVCIVLGSRVLRGSRAKKVDQSLFRTFETPKFPPLAEFHTDVTLHPQRMVRRKRRLEPRIAFNTNVVTVTLHPGLPDALFQAIRSIRPDGIVLRAYGQGMLPESLFPWLRQLHEDGIPVVITSQLLRGNIDLHLYRKQVALEKIGVISGKNLTHEAALVKLMWTLAHAKGMNRVRDIMERNLVGELDE